MCEQTIENLLFILKFALLTITMQDYPYNKYKFLYKNNASSNNSHMYLIVWKVNKIEWIIDIYL